MIKYSLTSSNTDRIDVSTPTERDYINGDTEFTLTKWETNSTVKYFEKSDASIILSRLPQDLQLEYRAFEQNLIDFIKCHIIEQTND